ncbi:MAG: hypothetical protein QW203_06750 [Thermoplasmatales archaeon]
MKLSTMGFLTFTVLFLGFVLLSVSGVITSAQISANIKLFGHFYNLIILIIAVAVIFGVMFAIIRRVRD